MSVFTVLWLDCNGERCPARFIPEPPVSLADRLREAAATAGWLTAIQNKVRCDYCPRCADLVGPRIKWTRGTCPVCDGEHIVTQAGRVALHVLKKRDRNGRLIPCDGGGLIPQRITAYGARGRQPYPGWKESA